MKTIVGLFDNFSQAESAVRDLEQAGYDRSDVSIVANESTRTSARSGAATTTDNDTSAAEGAGTGAVIGGVTGGAAGLIASLTGLAIPGIGPVLALGPLMAALTGAGVGAVAGGLIGALTSAGVPESHAEYYAEGVRRGGTLVTVSARDEDAEEVMRILNRHNPVDIEERAAQWRRTGSSTTAGTATPVAGSTTRVGGETATFGGQTTVASTAAAAGGSRTVQAGEQVAVPVVEEELRVGKREVETGGGVRVESRVEERPVEEQISLREEHVEVERRPVDRPATPGDMNRAFQGGTIELTERAEEAVVQKQARVVEEVVVGKEATERTETISDTVRRTDVEIQPVETGAAASASDFDNYEPDFRSNFQTTYRGNDYSYEHAKPAYRYGYSLASEGRTSDWSSVEPDARRRWEERNPGTWDKFKDAARYAWDRARSKTNA
jgi:uncharacterized protein (TIGR02271 family)